MKILKGSAVIAALILAGTALGPAAVMAEDSVSEAAEAQQATDNTAATFRLSNLDRAVRAHAEAASQAADAVLMATKLDLDIRLIGPISIAGDL